MEHNVRLVRDVVGPEARLMAVVKANAYGHGATTVGRWLLNAGADCLGVVSFGEARELRAAGIKVPIHVLGYIPPGRADEVIRYDLRPVVFSLDFVRALEVVGERAGKTVEVTVKVETGMNRHGLAGERLDEVMAFLAGARFVRAVGLSTHFARSDEADPEPTLAQMERMNAAIARFRGRGHGLTLCHAANSAATLLYPETRLDMVRCGLALYGLYPSPETRERFEGGALRPALEFKTRIVDLRTVQAGEAVSYGGTWVAERPTRIAVLPVGYADGYRRDLSNKAHVVVRGERAPILGRVCMNLSMVDVSAVPDAAKGDAVTLISTDPESGATVDDLAHHLGTINYEVVSGLAEPLERFLVP
jgi:alanine racemase